VPIRQRPAGSRLRIAIRDNGPGLTAEQKPRIFDPFYTTKTRHTGLGMTLAGQIAEVHGGVLALAMTTKVPARRSSLRFRPRSRNVRARVT
jgi:C4-dicarboxylate-specific signal transduction histidine kinase